MKMELHSEECTEEGFVTPAKTVLCDKLGECTSDCCQTSSFTSSPMISPSPTSCTFSPLCTTAAKRMTNALNTPYTTATSSVAPSSVSESPTFCLAGPALHRCNTVPDLCDLGLNHFAKAKAQERTPTKEQAPCSTPPSRRSSIMNFIKHKPWSRTLGSTSRSLQSISSLIASWDYNVSSLSSSVSMSPTVLPRSVAPLDSPQHNEDLQSEGSSVPSDETTESMEEDVETFVREHLEKLGGGPIPAFTLYKHMMSYYCDEVTNISYDRFLRCLAASAEFQCRDTGQLACCYRWRRRIPDSRVVCAEADEADFSCSECIEDESFEG